MKTFKIFVLGMAIAIGQAATAQALVTVTHTASATEPVPVGGTFTIDISVDYDGSPILTGIFTSAGWDPNQLMLTDNTDGPFAILIGATGSLSRLVPPGVFPGDPPGTLRTVQYGANPGQSAGAGSALITTLTFEVLAEGDGTAEIDVVFNSGDGLLGESGAPLDPADFLLVDTVVTVPEPGSAVLAFSALGAVGLIARRRNLGGALA